MFRWCWIIVLLAGTGAWAFEQRQPTSVSPDDRLAVDSLYRSIQNLVLSDSSNTPARASRLVTLVELAYRLDPTDPRIHIQRANIFELQNRLAESQESAEAVLRAYPDDYAWARRWLELKLQQCNDAQQRLACFNAVAEDEQRPAPLRSTAMAESGRIFLRQGDRKAALEAFRKALQWDSTNVTALRGLMENDPDLTDSDRVKLLLDEFRGNPLAVNISWELGVLLDAFGLPEPAITMFDYSRKVAIRQGQQDSISSLFWLQYGQAMLDADRAEQAVELLRPVMSLFADQADGKLLMIEAYQSAGKTETSDELLRQTERWYLERKDKEWVSPEELAWFYLNTVGNPQAARPYVAIISPAETNLVAQRIVAVAKLSEEESAEEALARLETLMEKDPYAAAYVAEYHYRKEKNEEGRQALLAGLKQVQSGPAWRKLKKLAEQYDVAISYPESTRQVQAVFEGFDRRYLEMALAPQKFIEVNFRPARKSYLPGEGLFFEAELKNRSELPIPLGVWGLMNPMMRLSVQVGNGASFESFPFLAWAAPRYLDPGAKIVTTGQLDLGELGRFLFLRPHESATLHLTGLPDPKQEGGQFRSALPGLPLTEAALILQDITGGFDATDPQEQSKLYEQALTRIVSHIKDGTLEQRVVVARQVVALLIVVSEEEKRKFSLLRAFRETFGRPLLLSMLRAILQDPSPTVRAEALVALQDAAPEGLLMALIGGLTSDPSPLVRLRLAELLGVMGPKSNRPVLQAFARDEDPQVREMAEAFLPKKSLEPPQ